MNIKTFVLLDHLDTNAPIYQRVDKDTRVKLKKIPVFSAYLQLTFTDKEGKNRTIRYKENANSIYQDEQIKLGILANERFTTPERKARMFSNGVLHTNKPLLYEFLSTTPENEKFEGISDVKPAFKEYIQGEVIKSKNADFMKRLDVGMKIKSLNLQQAHDLLIRINGSFFTLPTTLEEAQNHLVAFMDETDEDGLDQILKGEDELTADEKATIVVGNAIAAGILSFNAVEGQVSKIKNGKTVKLKDLPKDFSQGEKEKYFADFLTTSEGVSLFNDLVKDLEKLDSKK